MDCHTIIDGPKDGYFVYCDCKVVAVDYDRWGLDRHRIISTDHDSFLIWNHETNDWEAFNQEKFQKGEY